MVDISPTAIAEIKRLQLNRTVSNSSLRLIVKSGGCFGLYYDFEFDEHTSANGESSDKKSDRLIEINGINLIVSSKSWEYVEHLEVDYSEDLMGGGFRFYNPQVENICGCGISFAKLK